MKCYVGIDLGSTTTKAVILDEDGEVVGRGITNSRSDYNVACQVALTEALADTRFWLVSSGLESTGVPEQRRKDILDDLEARFRRQQYLAQLRALGETLRKRQASRGYEVDIRDAISSILVQMEQEAETLFTAGADRRSDFFRDLAGSSYLRLAEEESRRGGPSFDLLIGLYDNAILEVESTPAASGSFQENVTAAHRTMRDPPAALGEAVKGAVQVEIQRIASVGTGYGRQRLPFPKEQIRSEILCHGLGAHALFPGTRTVLDIGGQDTKAIQVDEKGIVTSFQMNDRCAAGCGRYLGYIADEMNLGLHEIGPLATRSTRSVRINSTCTVFAGSELRERLSLGEKREDIVFGLHRAIVLRAMSLLARSGGIRDEFTFTGGVAKNPAAVSALRRLVTETYGEVKLNTSPDSIYTGALGAALFALRSRPPGTHRPLPSRVHPAGQRP